MVKITLTANMTLRAMVNAMLAAGTFVHMDDGVEAEIVGGTILKIDLVLVSRCKDAQEKTQSSHIRSRKKGAID
jgi:uncharacterized lipoprotein NlpE involved in copper resistance